jgi:hypothetical protein
MRGIWILGLVATTGCTGEVAGGPGSLEIVSPSPGATFTRNALGSTGALVAAVPIELDVDDAAARVVVKSGDREVGAGSGSELVAELPTAGAKTLTVTALDANDAILATATVNVTIDEPAAASCHDWLELYKLDYKVGPANQGIADPITVQTPINGIAYRYNGSTTPRTSLYGDCSLIKSLAQAASHMRARDITTLVDIGVYNYRCIDQTKTPPNCTMSQHAYAKAIDIAAFVDKAGTKYTVLTDWVIDSGATCSSGSEPGKDTFLHEVICALKAADVWNIVLTPNYNAAHRNHFHVDLTTGSDTIHRDATEPALDGLVDLRFLAGVHGD